MVSMAIRLQNRFQALSGLNEQGESDQQDRQNTNLPFLKIQLAKKYFKLLQSTHHLEILNRAFRDNQLPPGMTKQVLKLTKFIKPACPNSCTSERVSRMTQNWMKEILKILIEHYETTISSLLNDQEEFDLEAFNKAITWAKTRYKRKFTDSSAVTVRDLVQSIPIGIPPLASSPVIPIISKQKRVSAQILTTQNIAVSDDFESGPGAPRQSDKQVSLSLSLQAILPPDQNNQLVTEPSPVLEGQSANSVSLSLSTQDKQSVEQNSQLVTEVSPSLVGQDKISAIALTSGVDDSHLTRGPSNAQSSEVAPTAVSVRLPSTNVISYCSDFDAISSSPVGSEGTVGTPDSAVISQTVEKRRTRMTVPLSKVIHQTEKMIQSESTSSTRADTVGPSGAPQVFFPTRHTRLDDHNADWTLSTTRPIVFMGDSNLSRIPKFSHSNIQIDSFPGSTFHHLTDLVKAAPVDERVELLVISAGILNCHKYHEPSTTWNQFLDLNRACKSKFPKALIYIAQISYSPLLDQGIIDRVQDFNLRVQSKCRYFLPTLDPLDFQVNARDKIHWLKRTAEIMFDFWLGCLNSLGGKHAQQPLL